MQPQSQPQSLTETQTHSHSHAHTLTLRSDPHLPHLTTSQTVHMTDVSQKMVTERLATAHCTVFFSNEDVYRLIQTRNIPKGDVFSVARIAGIIGAKKTADIVPLCHPGIGVSGVDIVVELRDPDRENSAPELKNREDSDGGYAAWVGDDAGASANSRYRYGGVDIMATVRCVGRTGVEMEALTAVTCAALTVYDMCKAVDKGIVITGVKVVEKLGGKSGHWVDGKKMA